MRSPRYIINLTPLLDILIILLFAQSIQGITNERQKYEDRFAKETESLKSENQQLKEHNEGLEKENETISLSLLDLQKEIQEISKNVEALKNTNLALEEVRKGLDEENSRLQEENIKLGNDKLTLEKVSSDLGEKNFQLGEENKKLREDNTKLHQENTKLDNDKKALEIVSKNLDEKNSQLGEENKKLHEDNTKLRADKDSISKSLSDLQKEVQEISKNIKALKDANQALEKDRNDLEEKNKELCEDNDNVKQSLSGLKEVVNVESILKEISPEKIDGSIEEQTNRVIEWINTQRNIANELKKHIRIWMFVCDAHERNKRHFLRLYIDGVENKSFSKNKEWDFDHSEILKEQIIETLKSTDIIQNTQLEDTNFVIWFYTRNVSSFAKNIFKDIICKAMKEVQDIYHAPPPEGRGKSNYIFHVPDGPTSKRSVDIDNLPNLF